MTRTRYLAAVLVIIALAGAAQARSYSPPTATPLTEMESLRVQNINLRTALLQREIADLDRDRAALKADIERARPGFSWSPENGAFSPTVPK